MRPWRQRLKLWTWLVLRVLGSHGECVGQAHWNSLSSEGLKEKPECQDVGN